MTKREGSSDAERESRWKRLRACGAAAMKRADIHSETELQDVLYEMRHGRKPVEPFTRDEIEAKLLKALDGEPIPGELVFERLREKNRRRPRKR